MNIGEKSKNTKYDSIRKRRQRMHLQLLLLSITKTPGEIYKFMKHKSHASKEEEKVGWISKRDFSQQSCLS